MSNADEVTIADNADEVAIPSADEVAIPSSQIPIEVGYWKIRGLGAPCRMICEYGGLDYVAKSYEVHRQEDGSYDLNEWFETKPDLKKKNALMNLPYIVDGDIVISQTLAILQYLGKKADLYGASPADAIKVDQILCEAQDLRNSAVGFFYSNGDKFDARVSFVKNVDGSYEKFESWLTHQGTMFTAGDTPTAGDFHLWEMLDQIEMLAADSNELGPLERFPRLKNLHRALRADPKLFEYFSSDNFKLPPNNKMAGWGGGEAEEWAKRFQAPTGCFSGCAMM